MPRTCTICGHPERAAIESALVAGTAYRDIARQFHVSKDAVARHAAEHLPRLLAAAHQAEEQAAADDLLAQMSSLHRRTLSVLGQAEVAGDLRLALTAIREARGNLELLAKLLGELDERPQVNILVAPQWLQVRSAIMAALLPYQEARVAVGQALIALDGGHDGRSA
jgi:hypothetical protein